MCLSIGIQDLCSHQPFPHLLKKELMEHLHDSLTGTTPVQGPPLISPLRLRYSQEKGMRDSREERAGLGERRCVRTGARLPRESEDSAPARLSLLTRGQPRDVSGSCCPKPRQTLPAARCRRIYRSRARGSRCLPEGGAPGCRSHQPTVLSLWTRSIQSPAPQLLQLL